MIARRTLYLGFAILLMASACSKGGDPASSATATPSAKFSAEMGSTFLYAKHPLDVEVGLFAGSANGVQLVTFGSVQVAFTYLGAANTPATSGTPGQSVTADYLPAPTTQLTGQGPSLSDPSTARGVYDARNVTFHQAGWWAATVAADVEGSGHIQESTTPFVVYRTPQLPAPGQPALKTENYTMSTPGVKPAWLDSLAQGPNAKVPQPWIHRWTIAKALAEHRPILVVFSTPAYCQSQFCGPTTDAVAELAKTYANRAVFIHVEIYKKHSLDQGSVLNPAAAQWLFRDRDLTEPWLYLVGANGIIQHQWGPLFSVQEVANDLRALPPMGG